MLLLAFFAFVVGAATAVSPCVLPVLPALLARAIVLARTLEQAAAGAAAREGLLAGR